MPVTGKVLADAMTRHRDVSAGRATIEAREPVAVAGLPGRAG